MTSNDDTNWSRTGPPTEPLGRPVRLAVLISGGGTTLANFLAKIAAGELDASVELVVASRSCRGTSIAAEAGVRAMVVPRREHADVESFSEAVFASVREADVDLVVLSGFLSLVVVPEDFRLRVMNIHPGLIPAFCGAGFYGHHVHEAVLEYGAKVSGCTVHFADDQYDTGPVVLQRCVPVREDDTPDALAARVFETECEAYPEAIRLFAKGRLRIDGRRVRVAEG